MASAAAAASKQIVDYRAQLKKELAGLRDRVPAPSGNRISLKGKTFNLPDGSSDPGPIGAVILDWRMTHEYYTGVYDPNKPASPVCWANSTTLDGMVPSKRVAKPQAATCAECPMNQFGSAPTGRGKACKNQRKLAIVPADAGPDTEPMILLASPTSLKNFDNYVNGLGAGDDGRMPIEVKTMIGMNPKEAYPQLVFGAPEILADDKLVTMFALREKAQAALDREPEPKPQ